jgi:hypothetical protein
MSTLALMTKFSVSPSRALQYDRYVVLSSKGFSNLDHAKASEIDTSLKHISSIKVVEYTGILLTLCSCCHHVFFITSQSVTFVYVWSVSRSPQWKNAFTFSMSTHATAWTPVEIYYAVSSSVDTVASRSRKRFVPDEDVKLMLECSDSDIRSVDSEGDRLISISCVQLKSYCSHEVSFESVRTDINNQCTEFKFPALYVKYIT